MRAGRNDVAASLEEIERVYRADFSRFVHVAAAITGDAETGRDAVQEAFVRAVRLRASFDGRGSLSGWLWRIVVRTARDQAAARRPTLQLADGLVGWAEAAEDDRLGVLVGELPERQRLVLFLRYYADLDYAGIAAVLDISTGTVGATLHAAHAALRAQMTEVAADGR
jgi:RNA polymerase sigma-70 factor (ECF subfamily)